MAPSSLLRQQFAQLNSTAQGLEADNSPGDMMNTSAAVPERRISSTRVNTNAILNDMSDRVGVPSDVFDHQTSPTELLSMSSSYADHPFAPPPSAAGGARPTQSQLSTPPSFDHQTLGPVEEQHENGDEENARIAKVESLQNQIRALAEQCKGLTQSTTQVHGGTLQDRSNRNIDTQEHYAGYKAPSFYRQCREQRASQHSMLDAAKVSRKLDDRRQMQDYIASLEQALERRKEQVLQLHQGRGDDTFEGLELDVAKFNSAVSSAVGADTAEASKYSDSGYAAMIVLKCLPTLSRQNQAFNDLIYAKINSLGDNREDDFVAKIEKLEKIRELASELMRAWRPMNEMPEAGDQRIKESLYTFEEMFTVMTPQAISNLEQKLGHAAPKTSIEAAQTEGNKQDLVPGGAGDENDDGTITRRATVIFSPGCHQEQAESSGN